MIEATIQPGQIQAGTAATLRIVLENTGPGTCTNIFFTVRLPVGLLHLGGKNRIGPVMIAAGDSVTEDMHVRAAEPGCYVVASSNFSYRDHCGHAQSARFNAEIAVSGADAHPPVHPPHVELETAELRLGGWDILQVRVTNRNEEELADLVAALSGRGIRVEGSARYQVGRIAAGDTATAVFHVRADEPGKHVPVRVRVSYRGPGSEETSDAMLTVRVGGDQMPGNQRETILFLAANPSGTSGLRIDREIRGIRQEIQLGSARDSFQIETREAVRSLDISRVLMEVKPHFVHFAGHGGGAEESFLVDSDTGEAQLVPVKGMVDLFKVLGGKTRCVLVNACQTEGLARGVKEALPHARVIGMRQPVGDDEAIRFSAGFYQAIGGGLDIDQAFDLGKAQVAMMPRSQQAGMPLLL